MSWPDVGLAAGILATTVFIASTLPMLLKAAATRDLRSYSGASLAMVNVGNLAQAVYALRRDLGSEDLVLGTTDLRLNPDLCDSDLARFRQALKEQRLADAVALYQGPFLDGIYLDEAPEFERWAETERTALAHDYIAALERLAQDTSAAGDPRAAVSYWRLLANADPLNAKSALGLMRALASAGDRAAALQHYRVYEMLLRQELELEPDAEVKRLADQLREAGSGDRAPFGLSLIHI